MVVYAPPLDREGVSPRKGCDVHEEDTDCAVCAGDGRRARRRARVRRRRVLLQWRQGRERRRLLQHRRLAQHRGRQRQQYGVAHHRQFPSDDERGGALSVQREDLCGLLPQLPAGDHPHLHHEHRGRRDERDRGGARTRLEGVHRQRVQGRHRKLLQLLGGREVPARRGPEGRERFPGLDAAHRLRVEQRRKGTRHRLQRVAHDEPLLHDHGGTAIPQQERCQMEVDHRDERVDRPGGGGGRLEGEDLVHAGERQPAAVGRKDVLVQLLDPLPAGGAVELADPARQRTRRIVDKHGDLRHDQRREEIFVQRLQVLGWIHPAAGVLDAHAHGRRRAPGVRRHGARGAAGGPGERRVHGVPRRDKRGRHGQLGGAEPVACGGRVALADVHERLRHHGAAGAHADPHARERVRCPAREGERQPREERGRDAGAYQPRAGGVHVLPFRREHDHA